MTNTAQQPEWAIERDARLPIVSRVSAVPSMAALPHRERRKVKIGEPYRFAFDVVVEPTSHFGKCAYIESAAPGGPSFEIFCDEGKALGGAETAPSPLAYFTAGVAFCLMTHITGYLRFTDLRIRKLRLEMRGNYVTSLGHVDRGGQGEGGCDSFESFLIIESDEPPERLIEFAAICERACIASQTIANAVPTSLRLVVNGNTL